jgi:hypothetical protein
VEWWRPPSPSASEAYIRTLIAWWRSATEARHE